MDWGGSHDSRLRGHDRRGVAGCLFSVLGASFYTYAEGLAISRWKPGFKPTLHALANFSVGCRRWRYPITRKRQLLAPLLTIRSQSHAYQEFALHHGDSGRAAKPYNPRGQGESAALKLLTLDHSGAAEPQVLQLAGTQPGDPGVAGATE